MNQRNLITADELSLWYKNILKETNLIISGPVKGTMFFSPIATKIWRNIQKEFKANVLDKLSINSEEVIFPTLIPKTMIEEEKEHFEMFNAELWETSRKNSTNILTLRPTSEVLFNSYFAMQNISYKDMPICYHQWANVFRVEENVKTLLRTSEFFWQEGHSFHMVEEEAISFAKEVLTLYIKFFNEVLLLPTFHGEKTRIEKFAGAKRTYGVETVMKDGQSVQIATSHNLSNNFSKLANGNFTTSNNIQKHAYGSSWGFSTRSMGSMLLMHGDDNGFIQPSRIAPNQLIIIAFEFNKWPEDKRIKLNNLLNNSRYRILLHKTKKNSGNIKWQEIKIGTPLLMSLGKKDFDNETSSLTLRTDLNNRAHIKSLFNCNVEELDNNIEKLLKVNDDEVMKRATSFWENNIPHVTNLEELKNEILTNGKPVKAYINLTMEEEKKMKKDYKFSVRVILDNEDKGDCIFTNKREGKLALIARAY